jgi:hypothetical protein
MIVVLISLSYIQHDNNGKIGIISTNIILVGFFSLRFLFY